MSNKQPSLVRVANKKSVDRLKSLVTEMIDDPEHLSIPYLKSHDWIAIPVESSLHFNQLDTIQISRAAAEMGCEEGFAILTESLNNVGNCYKVRLSPTGLTEFSNECGHFNFAILPKNGSFIILCTLEEYFLVGGPKKFIDKYLGVNISIEKAMEDFKAFAEHNSWPVYIKSHLLTISKKYRQPASE